MKKQFSCIIVDDQPICIMLMTTLVKQCSELNLVQTFTDPQLASAYIMDNYKIDVLFTDVQMPEISGIELAAEVYQQVEHVVFVTSSPKSEIKTEEPLKWYYLPKPVNITDLKKLLSDLTRDSRL
ncbi:MAG: response regulator [Chryseobacterium sp.]|nr:MAG: response regulator [Chryseobacterium sp.]